MVRKKLVLDKPFYVQYFIFLKNALRGNFGMSFVSRLPAMQLILRDVDGAFGGILWEIYRCGRYALRGPFYSLSATLTAILVLGLLKQRGILVLILAISIADWCVTLGRSGP